MTKKKKIRRQILYAHFDPEHEVKRYVLHTLRALREIADRLVFISTANLSAKALEPVYGLCDEVMSRKNVGFDFMMWRNAIKWAGRWDELVLTNSSLFGPFFPLLPIFESMAATPADVWGMTENRQIAYHLRAIFLFSDAKQSWRQHFASSG